MTKALGFLDIQTVHLPKNCAYEALAWMQKAGQRNLEGVALWAGKRKGEHFFIQKTIIPNQEAANLEEGLIYVVGGEELHRMALELFDSGMELIAQIHSHPGAAYHSDTDDAYPIVTVVGGLSVVVPNFAAGGLNLDEWAVYRLLPKMGWVEIDSPEKEILIHISDDPAFF